MIRRLMCLLLVCLFSLTAGAYCARKAKKRPKMQVTSQAFKEGAAIPAKYTADGADISPPIAWKGVPAGAKSIALIADDPDAPRGMWVHWVLFNLPPATTGLPEGMPKDATLKNGAKQGTTDFGSTGYGGPAPPSGTHRYYFKVYVLDKMLDLSSSAKKADLVKAMNGHILAEGQIMGKYSRR